MRAKALLPFSCCCPVTEEGLEDAVLCRCSAVAPQKHDSEETGGDTLMSVRCLSVVTVLTSFGSHKLRWVLFFIFGRGAFLPGVAHWTYFLFFFRFVLLQQTRA